MIIRLTNNYGSGQVKQMNNNKIEVRKKELKPNGDIVIDDFYFSKSKWCMLVPNIIKLFETILPDILVGVNWESIINIDNNINVTRLVDEDRVDRDHLLHYEYFIESNGRVVSNKDIEIRPNIDDCNIEKLTATVIICLHGLGLGSTRIAEIYRLQQHQVYWKAGNLYYLSISNKRGSIKSKQQKITTHKLPSEISRFLLIYDTIGMSLCKGREEFVFDVSSQEKIGLGNYKNKYLYSLFAELFEMEEKCGCLVMRHLYTCICNYIFPNNDNVDTCIVSTTEMIAEMSGHSAQTHELYYSSTMDKETFFNTYHQAIGSSITSASNQITKPFGIVDEEDLLNTLKVIYGTSASYFDRLQKEMIYDSTNNVSSHSFCGLSCGGGKSLSWIIPTLNRIFNGNATKISIVILPYCFLVKHHFISCQDIMMNTHNFHIDSLIGSEINDNILPNILRDKAALPSILFLSLEAIALLIKHHWEYIEELAEESLVHKIYIDECHTLLSELNFRNKYAQLTKLVSIGLPIMTLSGSFPKVFIDSYMEYFFGSRYISQCKSMVSENIFGQKLVSLGVKHSDTYLKDTCQHVIEFIINHNGFNAHVIVSTVNEGNYVFEQLKRKEINCEFIYSGSENQANVAAEWNNNRLNVLISTTLGLVGNESINTQLVCIVGLLYDLPSIVQAMGRIRPKRRRKISEMMIFIPNKVKSLLHLGRISAKTNFQQLCACRILSESMKERYMRVMTVSSVYEWLTNDTGCKLVSLACRMGYRQNVCNKCDYCTKSITHKSAEQQRRKIENNRKRKSVGIQLLSKLKKHCFCCKKSSCIGTCLASKLPGMNCYHCLGKHRANQCTMEYKSVLKNKACYSCFVFNHSEDCNHDYTQCKQKGEVQERLRGLIHHDFIEAKKTNRVLNFTTFISGIYATEETFFKYLYKYKNWK